MEWLTDSHCDILKAFCFILTFVLFIFAVGFYIMLKHYPLLIIQAYRRYVIMKTGFRTRSVTAGDGFQFEYIERDCLHPEKESILLIHGFTSTKDSFCTMAHQFPVSMHVIALDLPGHGGTTRRLDDDLSVEGFVKRLKQFVDLVGLSDRKFNLVGTSLGGYFCGMYASTYPEDLLKLSLICPAGVMMKRKSLLIETFEKEGKVLVMPQTVEEFKTMLGVVLYKKVKIPEALMHGVVHERIEADNFYQKVVQEFVPKKNRYKLTNRLEEIQCPTQVIWGDKDQIVDISCLEVIQEKVPHWSVKVFENCGHSLTIEEPRRLAREVIDFMQNNS